MARWNTVGRRWWTVVVSATALAMLMSRMAHPAFAQNPAKPDAWYAVVDTERLNVHSGRAEQFEKISTLKQGEVVLVKSVNTFGWAAIAPPSGLTGFVARQDVADGEAPGTVRAIGRVPVLYPISEDPAQCFRKSRVDADTVMKVLAEVPTSSNAMFLRVEMPEQVDVYVLAQFLRKATEEEVVAWRKKAAEETTAKASEQPPAEVQAPATIPPKTEEPKAEPMAPPTAVEPEAQPQAQPKAPPTNEETKQPETAPPMPIPPVADPAQAEAIPAEEELVVPAEVPEERILPTLPNLEQLYVEMRTKPILDAEIEPLLKSYEAFAASTEKKGEQRVAEIRLALLRIRLDQQTAMRELKQAAAAASEEIAKPKVEVYRDENGQPVYTAQGRMASSTVFDGRRLPLLFRIQDEITGRTIAYLSVEPKDRSEVERMLNLRVGVIGDTVHDAGLRIDVVHVKRVVDLESGE